MENGEPKPMTLDDLATMVAKGFADVRDKIDSDGGSRGEMSTGFAKIEQRLTGVDKRIDAVSYRVDQLDQKLDQHRQETKDGFDAMKRIMGGMSRTLTDHEERIKALEGE